MNQLGYNWGKLLARLQQKLGATPSLDGVLFLIGVRELGKTPNTLFTKEQKQDLMHIATCRVLSEKHFYELEFVDQDGWPHWKAMQALPAYNLIEQEQLLKECIILYFESMDFFVD
jgi:hypothetical protein